MQSSHCVLSTSHGGLSSSDIAKLSMSELSLHIKQVKAKPWRDWDRSLLTALSREFSARLAIMASTSVHVDVHE